MGKERTKVNPDQWEQLTVLRQRVERGLPCGTDEFVRAVELHL